ncbi:DNA-directed RNA polymerase subunit beta [Sporosarcina sp. NPDC096371]|uniref:DNA-directed RNA polymerase subunit beta n=1 Tax=Sporosarcina sp. NPDC096371 TaxID=3364530 RepID=UPI0038171CBF
MTEEKRNSPRRRGVAAPETTTQFETRSSRKGYKKRNVEKEKVASEKRLWVQVRLLPIWLRVLLVLVLLAGAALLGATIGYGYIGDGKPADILQKETWTHILDIMNGKES